MSGLPVPPQVEQRDGIDFKAFHDELRPAARPVVFRGLVSAWPAVMAARQGDEAMVGYLEACGTTRPVKAYAAEPKVKGRLFYNEAMSGLNFMSAQGDLIRFLNDLLAASDQPDPPALAVQSEIIPDLSPRLAAENRLDLLPDVAPRIWIGNRLQVAPHFDLKENLACCVAGLRRFTLFPPEQLANLYPGPFELTPAGTPVSMVDPLAPDLDRYPRFRDAWAAASQVTLEPGDALYIPYGWWHGVESLERLNILVNYWWSDASEHLAPPYDALLHAFLALKHLPPQERAVWRGMFDHYIFEADGDPAAHLPPHARGIMGPPSPQLLARMRATLRNTVS